MKSMSVGLALVLMGAASAQADDGDVTAGLPLYNKECAVCHGAMTHVKTGMGAPSDARARSVKLALASNESTMLDFPIPLSSDWQHHRLAVAPIYGPPLQGVIGRTAGTVKGYIYSKAFLEKMNGVVWDEATLDKWITSAQTMVPGSFMFVSLKNADTRGKIIAYLKTQTE